MTIVLSTIILLMDYILLVKKKAHVTQLEKQPLCAAVLSKNKGNMEGILEDIFK